MSWAPRGQALRWLMRCWAQVRSFARVATARQRLEAEMESELALHLEQLTDDLMAAGFSAKEAQRRARIALGSIVVHKDDMRNSLGLSFVDAVVGDLRYGARRLQRSVGFTVVATLSLALAIGANTTIFSLAKQLLYERLPVAHAAEFRLLTWHSHSSNAAVHSIWGDYERMGDAGATSSSFSYPAYVFLRAHDSVFEDLFAFKETGMNATIGGLAQRVTTSLVSGNFYGDLGVKAQLGRVIGPSDDAAEGQGAVAVISDGLWAQRFARSPAVLGQVIKLNNVALTIVGVNPRSFTGAKSVQQSPEIFVPMSMQPLVAPHSGGVPSGPGLLSNPNLWWVNVMGRIRPGVTDQQADTALDVQLSAVVHATMAVKPTEALPRMSVHDGSRGLFTTQRKFAEPMTVLLTMVGFVLLLACANIANLMLARGSQRQREMAIRLSLGAGRTRLARQMLVESLLLAAMGGALGLLLGYIGSISVTRLTQNAWEESQFHVRFDWGVFGFTAAISIVTGVLFGLVPAIAAARAKLNYGLKAGSASVTRRRKGWGGKSLVGFQVALSTLLVVGAGLFLRTLASLNAVDIGFRADHLLLVDLDPPARLYPAGKDILLHQRLEQAFAAIPGVASVTAAQAAYISDDIDMTDFNPEGAPKESKPDKEMSGTYNNVVGTDFFRTLEIPIVAGRAFGPQDTSTSAHVGIINQSLAKLRFPGLSPVGRRFSTHTESDGHGGTLPIDWITIVGVCKDTRYSDLRDEPPPQFMVPYVQQKGAGGLTYEIRSKQDPELLTNALRRAVQQQDADLPLTNIRTQQEQIEASTQQERIFVAMTSSFGMLALALASVGIYGVMAYSVANRTNEIGIRLALGALPRQVLTMVLREAVWISLSGVVVGLGAALALSRLVKTMLYGLQPADPVSMVAGAAILIAVALAASWLPARRAASVQPIEALRHE